MSQASSCIFCQLAAQQDSHVYDNEGAFAVRDVHPAAPGHTLIISKRHVPTAFDLADDEILAVARALREVRADLASTYGTDACNVVFNSGREAGQSVFHAHAHLIPRSAHGPTPALQGLELLITGR